MALAEAAQVVVQVESVDRVASQYAAAEAVYFVGDETYIVRTEFDSYLVFTEYTTTEAEPVAHRLEHGEHSMLALAVAQALGLVVCGRIAKTIDVSDIEDVEDPAYLT